MKGDKILVEENHYKAARKIVEYVINEIVDSNYKFTISVAGESGSGKSETAQAIRKELEINSITAEILQQDDYFVRPPKTNDAFRRLDIANVGPHEVNLELMDYHLKQFRNEKNIIAKPLVNFDDDKIESELLNLENAVVLIAEGTYTTLLENINKKIFIDRNLSDTLETRKKRSRAAHELDQFAEQILTIEHNIISKHKNMADIIITKDFDIKIIQR